MPDLLVDCPDCDGTGEIRWNPSPVNDPQLEESWPCQTCDGDGMLTLDEIKTLKRAA